MRTEHFKGVMSNLLIASLIFSLLFVSAGVARGQEIELVGQCHRNNNRDVAQSREIEWVRQFGAPEYVSGLPTADGIQSVAVDVSGNVYVTGCTGGALTGQTSSGLDDAFVRGYDASGNELWTRQFGTSGWDRAQSVAVDADGNIYVAGYTDNVFPGQTSSGSGDAFVRKYDASGNELWTIQFGTSSWDEADSVAVGASGNIYVAGYTSGALPGQSSFGASDAFVRKYSSSGSVIWTRQFGTSTYDGASGVAVDALGNVYVAGYTDGALPGQTSFGDLDAFVRKYNSSGSERWTRQFGTSDVDTVRGIAVDAAGNAYVGGLTFGTLPGQTSSGEMDAFVRKYNSSGSAIWTRQFGTFDWEYVSSVAVDDESNVYFAGETWEALPGQTAPGQMDAFVGEYDALGNALWMKQFGTPDFDRALGVAVDSSGNVYVGGQTIGAFPEQTSLGFYDAFLAKFLQIELSVEVSISPSSKSGALGETLTYTVTVKNTGNVLDNYALTANGDSGFLSSISQTFLSIPAGESGTATLSVTIPCGKLGCTESNTVVTATSQSNPRVSGSNSCTACVVVPATVDIDPDTLNLKSKGNWITAYIELPSSYNVRNIDVRTVRLIIGEHEVRAELRPTEIGDHDHDRVPDLMVKFDRQAVQALLSVGEYELKVVGKVAGATFEGSDTLRVIRGPSTSSTSETSASYGGSSDTISVIGVQSTYLTYKI